MAPRYAWVVKAYSSDSPVWKRLFDETFVNFKTEAQAWEAAQCFVDLLARNGWHDITIKVIKTIAF